MRRQTPTTTTTPDGLLMVEDVAARLRLTPRTIRTHMRAGRLRYLKFGRRLRFKLEFIEEFERASEHRDLPESHPRVTQ